MTYASSSPIFTSNVPAGYPKLLLSVQDDVDDCARPYNVFHVPVSIEMHNPAPVLLLDCTELVNGRFQ